MIIQGMQSLFLRTEIRSMKGRTRQPQPANGSSGFAWLLGMALAGVFLNAAPVHADSFLQEQFGNRPARRAHIPPRYTDPDDSNLPVPIAMPSNQQTADYQQWNQARDERFMVEQPANYPRRRLQQSQEWQRRLPAQNLQQWPEGQLRRSNNFANRPNSFNGYNQNGIQDWNDVNAANNARNGMNGFNGRNGMNGASGRNGMNGANGRIGMNGVNGMNGANGRDGINNFAGQIGRSQNNDDAASADPALRKPDKFADNPQVDEDGVRHFANGKHFDLSKMSLDDAIATTNASTLGAKKQRVPNPGNLLANGGNPLPYVDAPANRFGGQRQMASFQQNFSQNFRQKFQQQQQQQQPDWTDGQLVSRRNQEWRNQMDADSSRPYARVPNNRRPWND
jgi:hypothetical protein